MQCADYYYNKLRAYIVFFILAMYRIVNHLPRLVLDSNQHLLPLVPALLHPPPPLHSISISTPTPTTT